MTSICEETIDKNGGVVVKYTYSYDAFGNLISSTGSTANSYLYCGEQYDSTTGLYYLRARYMDTNMGRFISMDTYQGSTADPISLHKYLYANSNPVTYTDPSGYYADNMTAAAGMAILNQTVQLNAVGIFNSIMAVLAAALTPVVGNLLTQYLLLQIENIASGNTTSAEANEEARDEAVGDATGGSGTGSAAPYPDDNGNKNKKKPSSKKGSSINK
ncbi:MAG: RHS repeat-associated core domain-containing protein [Oscillospiraceae bacterium]